MSPESIAARFAADRIQTGPLPDARAFTVGADDPARTNVVQACHVSTPTELYTDFLRAVDQNLVQPNAPYCDTRPMWKVGRNGAARADKTDPAKSARLLRIDRDTQPAQGLERIRHQALAARFVDGWLRRVGDHNVETLQAGCDGGSQSGGSTANDEDVRPIYHGVRLITT